MSNEECFKLKVGQIIYSNHGANPLKIVAVPRIGEYNDFVVMDIHDCKHVESSKYIKENFEIKPIKPMTREEAAHLSDVLKAYSEGKEIEVMCENGKWLPLCKHPYFTGNPMTYRIKPEPKLRPYKNAEEFLKAQKEHGPYLQREKYSGFRTPVFVGSTGIKFSDSFDGYIKYKDLLDLCKWQDGTPCAILEE